MPHFDVSPKSLPSNWLLSLQLFLLITSIAVSQSNLAADSSEGCAASDPQAGDASTSGLTYETSLVMANPGNNTNQQTFVRIVNPNDGTTDVEIYGIDDSGNQSRKAPVTFTLEPQASIQISTQEMEDGNTAKGLVSNLCDGQGKWQFRVRSSNPVTLIGLIRTPDGFLTGLVDTVPGEGSERFVYFANPASNNNQQTFLRVTNQTANEGTVAISGIDDLGITSSGTVSFSLGANASKQITTQDLENGNTGKGLTGNLDNGSGKWRLTLTSTLALEVISMIRTPDGFLTNLSSVVDANNAGERIIYFANPASETTKSTFLRVINSSGQDGTVTVSGTDDNGNIAPGGDVSFALTANASKQITTQDLEGGNSGKGLLGMLGDGEGRWRLAISADVAIEVMSLIRTPDGFLTNLSRTTPVSASVNDVAIFNPASNVNQRSSLRIVNDASQQGSVTISGIDDTGNPAPGGSVTFNITAGAGMLVTAQDLEQGNAELGLVGALGNGAGKWRLQVTSDVDLQVQSLLDTQTGFLTNLSATSAPSVLKEPLQVADAISGGIWTGSITSNASTAEYIGFSTDAGSFRFFSLDTLAQFHGDFTVSVNDLSGSGLAVLDRTNVINVTITGEIVERTSLTANWQGGGDSGVIDFQYSDLYERAGTLSNTTGSWQGTNEGQVWITLTINNGTISGSDALNCTHNGSMTPVDPMFNLYLITDTLSGCSIEGDYSGFAAFRDTSATDDTIMFAVDNSAFYITGLLDRQ